MNKSSIDEALQYSPRGALSFYVDCIEKLSDERPIIDVSHGVAIVSGLVLIGAPLAILLWAGWKNHMLAKHTSQTNDGKNQIQGYTSFSTAVVFLFCFMFATGSSLFMVPTISSWVSVFPKAPGTDVVAKGLTSTNSPVKLLLSFRSEAICNRMMDSYFKPRYENETNAIASAKEEDYRRGLEVGVKAGLKKVNADNISPDPKAIEKIVEEVVVKETPLLGLSIPVFYTTKAGARALEISKQLELKGAVATLIQTDFSELKNDYSRDTVRMVFTSGATENEKTAVEKIVKSILAAADVDEKFFQEAGPYLLRSGPIQVQVF